MAKKFDLLVFIGRFQPFHRGHEERVRKALEVSERVLILVGSSNRARSPRNPFTYDERSDIIRKIFHFECSYEDRVMIYPLSDFMYNDTAWMTKVRESVSRTCAFNALDDKDLKIGLIGFDKDHTSYYLNIFGEWENYQTKQGCSVFDSTSIRRSWFRDLTISTIACSDATVNFLKKFSMTEEFRWLVAEDRFNTQYKKSWEHAPFPPTIMTVDPVVVQSGHVLLVERGGFPGKGLLAFPGGHLNQNELLVDAVVRELIEETDISNPAIKGQIPPARLKSFIKKEETFDDPHRSERARVITHAYLFELPNSKDLWRVKGGDDAVVAKWYPISDIKGPMMFEDHYFIMCKMLGLTIE